MMRVSHFLSLKKKNSKFINFYLNAKNEYLKFRPAHLPIRKTQNRFKYKNNHGKRFLKISGSESPFPEALTSMASGTEEHGPAKPAFSAHAVGCTQPTHMGTHTAQLKVTLDPHHPFYSLCSKIWLPHRPGNRLSWSPSGWRSGALLISGNNLL